MRFRVIAQGRNPGLGSEPVITDLFNKSPLWGLCESVVGEGKLIAPRGGSVKLNFPDAEERPLRGGHLDLGGKLKDGLLNRGMTLLVVVLVHDVPRPFMGNFCFWPGSHRVFEAAFQKDPITWRRQRPIAGFPMSICRMGRFSLWAKRAMR